MIIIAFILCPILIPEIRISEAAPTRKRWQFPLINATGNVLGKIIQIISFADAYKAIPSNITIGYNENVTIKVGVCDMETGQFEPPAFLYVLTAHYLSFSAEFPQGNPGGSWFVNFNPPLVYQNTPTDLLVTNATISLTSPPSVNNPIQSTIIRIKIANVWVAGNFWLAGNQPGYETFLSKFFWFAGAFTAGYGKFSGKILTDYINVDVLVNVKPYHAVKIQALQPDKLSPNQIATIPVLVENQGNYNDTFNFRIKTETGYPLALTSNNTITLQPGEQGQALVGVAASPNTLDTGTLHSIIIESYSAEQPNTSIATQRIFLETQGFYFSEQNSVYTIGFGFFILFVLSLFIYWGRKKSGKNSKKPEKPWKIPEERQHLQELKRTDKKVFEQERIMMEDEYKSALLWYEGYRKSLRKKPKEKKPKKKQKEKPKKRVPAILKKSIEKPKEEKVESIVPVEDKSKEKALAKIKSEQEKQLRKMKEK